MTLHAEGEEPSAILNEKANDAKRPEHEDLGFDLPAPAKPTTTRIVVAALVFVAVIGAAFVVGWLPKRRAQTALAESSRDVESQVLRVQTVAPTVKTSDRALTIPGSVQPLEQTVVYPRANGYLRSWAFDMGDKVKEGQVLAEIETPELDQQLDQARAQLAQAEASLVQTQASRDFSKTNLDRYVRLTPAGVTSQAELEQKQAQSLVDDANVKVAQANVEAQRANIRRMTQLKSFAHVVAPFGGRLDARMIDRGTLVSPATPLFKISATDPVRVFVQVPQDVAPSVHVGASAKVTIREFAGRVFEGKIARSAGTLDPASRTMTIEVRVPNPSGEVLGGMYAQVELSFATAHRVFELPATAINNDANGVRVATVTPEGTIHLLPVVVERDTGSMVEIASGLDTTDRIVKLGSAALIEGRHVDVAK